MSRFLFVAPVLCGLLSGFGAGKFSAGLESRRPSSQSVDDQYQNVPCADRKAYAGWVASLKFQGKLNGDLCDPKSQLGRFARVLVLLNGIKTKLPPDWRGGAADAITDPFGFVSRMSESMQLDLSQVTSIAFNAGGSISIGGAFFTYGPADSASTLVHEAQHSAPNDPGHAQCIQGDIPWSAGGCDEAFSVSSDAGAYSYETSLGYGVAAYNTTVTEAQKEFLLSNSVFTLSHRFNVIPEALAVPMDHIIVLDEAGAIFDLDAIDGKLRPASFSPAGAKFDRIRRGKRNNTVFGFTGDRVLATPDGLDEPEPMQEYFSTIPLSVTPVRDIGVLSVGSLSEQHAAMYFLSTANELFESTRDPKTGKPYFKKADCQPGRTQLQGLSLARGARYFLGQDRQAYSCDENEGDTALTRSGFADSAGFRQLEGGLLFSDLFGVTTQGRLKIADADSRKATDSDFLAPAPILKYLEGVGFRAALLEGNSVVVQSWDGKISRTFGIEHDKKIVDFVITRRPIPADLLHGSALNAKVNLQQALKARCGVEQTFPGIWTPAPIGIDHEGRILKLDPGEKCVPLDLSRFGIENAGVSALTLQGVGSQRGDVKVTEAAFLLKQAGKDVSLRPYFFPQ